MQMTTAATLGSVEATSTVPITTTGRKSGPARSLFLMGSGVIVLALAAFTLFVALPERSGPTAGASAPASGPAPETAQPAGLTIQGPGDITVLNMTYEAGETSGWHSHRGVHAVAILSGELVVTDANCVRTTYGPGNPYIGGQHLHLIRNETDGPVPMVVTYLNPTATSQAAHVVTTPPTCAG